MTQVQTLYLALKRGEVIDRVNAFKRYGIADLRSRICNAQDDFGVRIDRRTKPGKRYKQYFIKK